MYQALKLYGVKDFQDLYGMILKDFSKLTFKTQDKWFINTSSLIWMKMYGS